MAQTLIPEAWEKNAAKAANAVKSKIETYVIYGIFCTLIIYDNPG